MELVNEYLENKYRKTMVQFLKRNKNTHHVPIQHVDVFFKVAKEMGIEDHFETSPSPRKFCMKLCLKKESKYYQLY